MRYTCLFKLRPCIHSLHREAARATRKSIVGNCVDDLILTAAERILADESLALRCMELQNHAPRGLSATTVIHNQCYFDEIYEGLQLLASIQPEWAVAKRMDRVGRTRRKSDGPSPRCDPLQPPGNPPPSQFRDLCDFLWGLQKSPERRHRVPAEL